MDRQSTPRLCIGLPVCDGEAYLAPAIASLLEQTFTDFRLIIADNGSTDGTESICREIARRDARVEYHRSPVNRGISWNFNRVVAMADSEYFKWASDDDIIAPSFLARCIRELDEHPRAVLAYTHGHMIDATGRVVRRHREPLRATGATPAERWLDALWNWGACTLMFGVYRLDVLRQTCLIGPYPASDLVMVAELALHGELREVDEPLFFWRNHAERPTLACDNDPDLATMYDPANAGRMQFRHLTLLVNYLHAIRRVPLPLGQRLRCWTAMAQWFVLQFPTIQDEIRGNIAGPVRRAIRHGRDRLSRDLTRSRAS